MKLTNLACKNSEPRDKPYKMADGDGMYLYIMQSGSKYWHFKYRYGGKQKRLALGVYDAITSAIADFITFITFGADRLVKVDCDGAALRVII